MMHNFTAAPLTFHRHAGLVPASRTLLKPLDSGLRRNDGKVLTVFMSQFNKPAYMSTWICLLIYLHYVIHHVVHYVLYSTYIL